MPRKKEKQFESALDSIYNLVFAQKTDKPKKLKPRKPTGAPSSGDMFTNALTQVAANPGVFVTEQTLKSLDGNLSASLFDVHAFGAAPSGEIEIKTKDLGKFIMNPAGFIDGAVEGAWSAQQADGDLKKLQALGKAIDGVAGFALGKMYGLKTMDAWNLGTSATQKVTPAMEAQMNKMISKAAAYKHGLVNGMTHDEADELGDHVFDSLQALHRKHGNVEKSMWMTYEGDTTKGDKVGGYRERVSPTRSAAESKRLGRPVTVYGLLPEEVQEEVWNGIEGDLQAELVRRGVSVTPELLTVVKKDFFASGADGRDANDPPSPHMYRRALHDYLNEKSRFYVKKSKEWESLQKAAGFVQSVQRTHVPAEGVSFTGYRRELDKVRADLVAKGANAKILKKIDASIDKLKACQIDEATGAFYSMSDAEVGRETFKAVKAHMEAQAENERYLASIAGTPDEREEHMEKYNAFKKDAADVGRMSFGDTMPKVYAYLTAFRANFVQGGFARGIITGDFFSKGKDDPFSPSAKTIKPKLFIRKDQFYNQKTFDRVNGFEATANDKFEADRLILPKEDTGWKVYATTMYYFTPGSLLNTALWNGEGFQYIAVRNQAGIVKRIMKFAEKNPAFKSALFSSNWIKDKKGNLDEELITANLTSILDDPTLQAAFPQFVGPMLKVYNNGVQRMLKLAKPFMFMGKRRSLSDIWKVGTDNIFAEKGIGSTLLSKITGGRVTKGFRGWSNDLLRSRLMNFPGLKGKAEWTMVLEQFGAGHVGVDGLVKTAVQTFIQGLGLSTGPVGIAVSTVLSWILTQLADSATKAIMKVAMSLFWLFIATTGLFLCTIFYGVGTMLLPQRMVNPVTAQGESQFPEYVGTGNIDPNLPPGGNFGIMNGVTGACITGGESFSCGQGPNPKNPNWTHANMGTGAIDITYYDVIKSPCNGSVEIKPNMVCGSDSTHYGDGAYVHCDDGSMVRIFHLEASIRTGSVSEGQELGQMAMQPYVEWGDCWMGNHYHIDVLDGGSWVDAREWLIDLCEIPFFSCNGD